MNELDERMRHDAVSKPIAKIIYFPIAALWLAASTINDIAKVWYRSHELVFNQFDIIDEGIIAVTSICTGFCLAFFVPFTLSWMTM